MTKERQGRIRELFDAALDQPAYFRREFLFSVCDGDQLLFETVDKLLAANERSSGILDTPIRERREVTVAIRTPGSYIGPYKILQELTGGGMGVVYQAVRADEVFQRVCAVKVIRAELATPWLMDRFRKERQILARLDHTNIARIIDGGATPDDLPYFVMDYVDGPPINKFCAQHDLNARQRLALYRQACVAVEYLHRNGVIHGDLKPPNILVGNDGSVKLVDFGIATILSAADTSDQRQALPLMTPGYASPEQMRGLPLTPSSDVYSLGIILYELLAGAQPFPSKGRSRSEILNLIDTQDPVPPSLAAVNTQPSAAAHVAMSRPLKADLDSIVLSALHRNPQKRYQSVADLNEDINRFLSSRPVRSRQSGPLHNGRMLFLRHKSLAWASAIIVLLLGALSWEGVVLYRSYKTALKLEDQVRTLEVQWVKALEENPKVSEESVNGSASRERMKQLLNNQLGHAHNLADAYRTSFPEAVHIWPGMNQRRRELLKNTEDCLHQAEPIVGRDSGGTEELANAWLWLANLQGNPRTVNLHDRPGATASIEEAQRLLNDMSNPPAELASQVQDAAAQIKSGGE